MISNNKDVEFIVEKIMHKRQRIGITEYLVMWKGYTKDQATWEPADNLEHARKKIQCFERRDTQEQRKLKRRANRRRQMEFQNQLYSKEKIQSYQQLKEVINGEALEHPLVAEVKPSSQEEFEPMTFEKFIDRPPQQLIKIQRYSVLQGVWTEKLESCSEIVGKNSARQKYRSNSYQDRINIQSISILGGQYIVRFIKDQRHYQSELKQMQHLCPNEIIDYLLANYDPSQKVVLSSNKEDQVQNIRELKDLSNRKA